LGEDPKLFFRNLEKVFTGQPGENCMATVVVMPQLSISMSEGTIEKWLKKEGDSVQKGEILLTILTDKVSMDYESPASGILKKILREENEKVPVLDPIGVIGALEEDISKVIPGARMMQAMHQECAGERVPERAAPGKKRIIASPLAKKMAQEHDVDLAKVAGTGVGGKIDKDDVLRAIKEKEAVDQREKAWPLTGEKDFLDKGILETIPIRGMRRVIFENMHISLQQTAQLTLHTEACAQALIGIRDRLNERLREKEVKYSYNAILAKMVAKALRLHPRINASVEGHEIKVWRQVNIGVAIDSENGLIVLVIRNADQKSLLEINQELNRLIGKIKENCLSPDDLANGTFTISNLGFADIDHFTPILRPPESGLLGMGRIVEKPVVRNGEIIAEARMGLSFTFDHRIIDGAPAARFLKTVKEIIEDPSFYPG
jgi:pyruvate dehydrogenase E2 component (dihydrolipoamide acetyltransferase)